MSWASLVAQMVKNPPAMWETWVGSLGWEDPLEEGMATHRVASQAGGQRWRAESQGSRTRRWRYFTDPFLRSCPRSAEALTPLHVAAAWGCRRGLELLLSQGADPALRDQVGGPIAVCSKANPEGKRKERRKRGREGGAPY